MTLSAVNKKLKKIVIVIIGFTIIIICLIAICNLIIIAGSKKYIYSNVQDVPYNTSGLLLGTSKSIYGGMPNPYFANRIKAAVLLYKAGKIKYIIVSGDNNMINYNEPVEMKKELIKRGVPNKVIFLDYAGFRTFDSVVRCNEIFGQNNFTIISQRFHLERAIFISHHLSMNTIGFEAEDIYWTMGFKTMIREYFARVLVFWDIYSGRKPKFLGEKVNVK